MRRFFRKFVCSPPHDFIFKISENFSDFRNVRAGPSPSRRGNKCPGGYPPCLPKFNPPKSLLTEPHQQHCLILD